MQHRIARLTLLVCLLPALLATACTDAAGPKDTATGDDTGDAPVWPPDPATYDCRAPGQPDRVNTVPMDCMTDRSCETLLVSGHRGMGGTFGVIAPEDTVSAVYAAIAFGVDYVETDPRPTADDHLVNLHDDDVFRTTGGTGQASEMTLAEIQALPIRADAFEGDFSCERVPTLEEVLLAAKGRVHVLIDANKTNRVDLLVQAVVETDTFDEAIFDTSSVEKIDEALALEPSLHTMIRVDDATQLADQLAHFADHPPVIVEIEELTAEQAVDVLAAGHRPLMDTFITDIAANGEAGLPAYDPVWEAGVVIIQTERPERVLEALGRTP
jgi:glycerophosphoryl diester phosphodiesterase